MVEIQEGSTEILPLPENGQPAEASLKTLQTDFFEQSLVIGDRDALFRVVVAEILLRWTGSPAAPGGE